MGLNVHAERATLVSTVAKTLVIPTLALRALARAVPLSRGISSNARVWQAMKVHGVTLMLTNVRHPRVLMVVLVRMASMLVHVSVPLVFEEKTAVRMSVTITCVILVPVFPMHAPMMALSQTVIPVIVMRRALPEVGVKLKSLPRVLVPVVRQQLLAIRVVQMGSRVAL